MKNIIGQEFLQHCGDSLKVIDKSKNQDKDGSYLYICEFIKYPFIKESRKDVILKGQVINPEIERIEFVEKIWPQHCGDSVRILEKSNKKGGFWNVEFINKPIIIKNKTKQEILQGSIVNPLLENFVGNIFPQTCGDSLLVLEKTTQKSSPKNHHYLYKCEFQKYPNIVYAEKANIIRGNICNYFWDIKNKFEKFLIEYIKQNNKKISLEELCFLMNRSKRIVVDKIFKFELHDYIDINFKSASIPEEEIRAYCKSINSSFLNYPTCKILEGKEIDIYSSKLKLGFEFNGDYWHSDEICYKNYGISSKERDLFKYNLAKEKGVSLYFIWEHDWNNRPEVVKRYIKIIINKQLRKIYKY